MNEDTRHIFITDKDDLIATITIKSISQLTAKEITRLCSWMIEKANEIAANPQDYSDKFTARFSVNKSIPKVIGKNLYTNHIIRKMSMPKRKGDDITHGGI
jgi:hypothetical protein